MPLPEPIRIPCEGTGRSTHNGLCDVDTLAQIIRRVDGNHSLGAGALAEAIHDALTKKD